MAKTLAISNSANHLKDSFLKVNRMRLVRTQDFLSAEQSHFLELLPLLFHINHPDLPGHISEQTAAGISQYSPGFTKLKAAKTLSSRVKLERRARHQMNIYSLFCMGSIGELVRNLFDLDIHFYLIV